MKMKEETQISIDIKQAQPVIQNQYNPYNLTERKVLEPSVSSLEERPSGTDPVPWSTIRTQPNRRQVQRHRCDRKS